MSVSAISGESADWPTSAPKILRREFGHVQTGLASTRGTAQPIAEGSRRELTSCSMIPAPFPSPGPPLARPTVALVALAQDGLIPCPQECELDADFGSLASSFIGLGYRGITADEMGDA